MFRTLGIALVAGILGLSVSASDNFDYDVLVYTGNAAGCTAAQSAAKEGANVLVVEPSKLLGGMTGGGIEHIDWGNPLAVGGEAHRVLSRSMNSRQYREYFADILEKNENVTVMHNYRVASVHKTNNKITRITLDYAPHDEYGVPPESPSEKSVKSISAKVFIDASYDGELMARDGDVSYTWGREAKSRFSESHAGAEKPLMAYDIDPYVEPGNKHSGFIPLIQDFTVKDEDSADDLVMGYGFRWKWAMNDGHEITPHNYDPDQFELFRRGFLAAANGSDVDITVGHFIRDIHTKEVEDYETSLDSWVMPQNLRRSLLAPMNYGQNKDYPDGDYKTKARIWKEEQSFVRNLIHFFKTDESVPKEMAKRAKGIKLAKGEFDETNGYPNQLYIREARRMQSDYIITQKDMENERGSVHDPITLATYGVDEWPYATVKYAEKDFETDGVALVGGYYSCYKLGYPYAIPYRAVRPKKSETSNLLVPVTVSATHVAFSSIRMEPVYMQLGQAVGIAAAMAALNNNTDGDYEFLAVQDIDYDVLASKLTEEGIPLKVDHAMKKDYENLKSGNHHQDINMMTQLKGYLGITEQGFY
jgi:hypothetical protein